MTNDVPSNDSAAFMILEELRSYLKTEKEVGEPTMNERNRSCIPVRIKISNTAPNDVHKALVVYTGITVHITLVGHGDSNPKWAHTGGIKEHYKLESQRAESAWFPDVRSYVVGFDKFPKATQDETRQGHVLFPGDSLAYEFLVPVDDLQSYEFHVDGNVSRRHLFHFKTVLRIQRGTQEA